MRKMHPKIKKPSEEFERFLEMVNLLRGHEMPPYSDLFKHFKEEWIAKLGNDTHQVTVNAREEAVAMIVGLAFVKFPEQFRDYIYERIAPNEVDETYFLLAYESFRKDRNALMHTVAMIERQKDKQGDNIGEILISIMEPCDVSINLN